MANTQSPFFEGLSVEEPSILTVSFASNPAASLGVKLCNHDNGLTNEMFLPGYASVGGMLDDQEGRTPTLAKKHGVRVGDHIVAVNGDGFRRFPPDFDDARLEDVTEGLDLINLSSPNKEGNNGAAASSATASDDDDEIARASERKGRVVANKKTGEAYDMLLSKIREVKSARDASDPLLISLERYAWDSRPNSWSRFLSARKGNVPEAMTLIQGHERWRSDFFPVDLTQPSLQKLLRAHAVSEIDVASEEREGKAPVVYIDFAKLQAMGVESETISEDVVKAFVVYTETLLSKSEDPRSPKTSQFVDLTGVSIKQGLQPGVLKKLYATFEPNYPETLERMVLYPVPRVMVRVVNAMLSFVNEHTRKKFIITDDLFLVCKELGWNLKEIETCGSVNAYMKKHLKHGLSFVFD